MLNYVEGQARIDGQTVTPKSVGTAEVEQGQVLETGKGKAEILLTPGVFLRLGDNSAARLDADGLTHTSVELLHGEALVEADDLHPQNNIQVIEKNSTTTLDKNGIYAFQADQGEVSVYDGKATVNEADKHVDLKKGKQTLVADLHSQGFNKKQEDDLYRWSDLRSHYLSEESVASSQTYFANNSVWNGGGWYWNPYFASYSWLPGDGLFYSPFGYGFFSPFSVYGGYPFAINTGYGHYGDRSGGFGRGSGAVVGGSRAVGSTGFGRSSGFTAAARPAGGGFGGRGFGGGGARGGRR